MHASHERYERVVVGIIARRTLVADIGIKRMPFYPDTILCEFNESLPRCDAMNKQLDLIERKTCVPF